MGVDESEKKRMEIVAHCFVSLNDSCSHACEFVEIIVDCGVCELIGWERMELNSTVDWLREEQVSEKLFELKRASQIERLNCSGDLSRCAE